jgi:pimeloyl-ACP methyl ester carboxylesterase
MFRRYSIVVAGVVLSVSSAFAQWSPQAQKIVNDYNQKYVGKSGLALLLTESPEDRDPYLRQTVEAAEIFASNYLREGNFQALYPGAQMVQLPLQSKGFTKPGHEYQMPAMILWQKEKGQIAQRDLMIYNPGIFQSLNNPFTYRAVQLMFDRGYHVLVIPNAFTDDYVENFPLNPPGSIESEAQLEVEAIQAAKTQWQSHIKTAHLVGISYGGFVTAITAALDAATTSPLIDGQVTIMGPQVKLRHSLDLLDGLIDSYFQFYNDHIFANIIGGVFFSHLAHIQEVALQEFLFHQSHQFTLMSYAPEVITNFNRIPDPRFEGAAAYKTWRNQLRFLKTLQQFAPQNESFYSDGHDELAYWMRQLQARGNSRFRVLTTADDFTNRREDWGTYYPADLSGPDHLLVRAHGSHNAFVTTRWFERFLAASL